MLGTLNKHKDGIETSITPSLTSSYKYIRLYATRHLGEMIFHSPTANTWTLRLLLTQLYDPAMEVCELATQFLEEACESVDILQLVVAMQPTLDHLGDVGHGLLMKFMSTPVGFRYLFDSGYIDREMDIWLHEPNIHYLLRSRSGLRRPWSLFQWTTRTIYSCSKAWSHIIFSGRWQRQSLGVKFYTKGGISPSLLSLSVSTVMRTKTQNSYSN